MRTRSFLIAAFSSLILVACGGGGKKADTAGGGSAVVDDKPLYDRLGGKDAITAVVDDFVANVVADKRIDAFFANADIPGLKQKLVDQLCEASGGPCKYTGKDMKTAHAGMGVKDADFTAMIEDLGKSLDKFKVPVREKTELLAALAAMKADIISP